MRYFLDTEFDERGNSKPITLISIGIVSEDGREFYGINGDYDWMASQPWLRQNVEPHIDAPIGYPAPINGHPRFLANKILNFIGNDEAPEFWGYYSDYDWVVFCQLFGSMSEKPDRFPMRCNDLRQALDNALRKNVVQPEDAPHNALLDARWIRDTFNLFKQ